MSRIDTTVDELVQAFSRRRPLRTGSLVMTVYGDAIAPRGGVLWLSSLINLLRIFELGERLIRTSVTRLARDNWLEALRVGRQSMYGLSHSGAHRLEQASARIYQEPNPQWDGQWHLVLLGGVDARRRDTLRKRLTRLGFGSFSGEVMAHPTLDHESVEEHLAGNEDWSSALMVTGHIDHTPQTSTLQAMIRRSWALDDLNDRHKAFLQTFRPVYQRLLKTRAIAPLQAYRIRTLLIHEYRKTALRDPQLPKALLPDDWMGFAAYQLCRSIYARVAEAGEAFISETAATTDGPLPPPEPTFFRRFGAVLRKDS